MEIPGKNEAGSISEWNEGTFKSIRLHEAQEMINYGKAKPFSLGEDGIKWRYEVWFEGINILYGEGNSKYSDDEKDEVEKIKKLLEKLMEFRAPFKIVRSINYEDSKLRYIPLKENQKSIKKFLEAFEKITKDYNDLHGLSTRNREEENWKGL